ncbi:flavodoxin [Lacrimispora sp.]|uniref:flavodoxin n=1 Tax=Lacrimispora sp. TaxID=2719234 RepID=UPI00345F8A6C
MLTLIMLMSVTACGNSGAGKEMTATTPAVSQEADNSADEDGMADKNGQKASAENGNVLIAYFSFPETDGTDTDAGASRVVADGELLGNTEYLANVIYERTGGDLFAIETVQEYPGIHEPLIEQAAEEQDNGVHPELSTHVENMEDYDVIFLGYPNWWADMPMPLYSFLEEYDLSGKTIIPFNSHGGSRFSNTIAEIQKMQPGAEVVTDGFTVSRNDVGNAGSDLNAWMEELGY